MVTHVTDGSFGFRYPQWFQYTFSVTVVPGSFAKKNKHRASVRFHSLICLKCVDIFKLSKYLCLFSFNILMLNNCKQIHFVVQLLNLVQLFATSWTAACQASLSFIVSQSLFKLMFIKLMIPSNRLILCHPVPLLPSVPAPGSFPMSWLFASGDQSIGASASVFPMHIQGWFPLGLTGLISLLSRGLSRVFSNTTVQKHQLFGAQPSLWSNSHICTWLLEKP